MCSVSMTLMRPGCVARVVPRSLPSTDDVEDNKLLVSLLHCNPTSWTDLDKLARLTLELKENAETYKQHRVPMMQSARIVFILQITDPTRDFYLYLLIEIRWNTVNLQFRIYRTYSGASKLSHATVKRVQGRKLCAVANSGLSTRRRHFRRLIFTFAVFEVARAIWLRSEHIT